MIKHWSWFYENEIHNVRRTSSIRSFATTNRTKLWRSVNKNTSSEVSEKRVPFKTFQKFPRWKHAEKTISEIAFSTYMCIRSTLNPFSACFLFRVGSRTSRICPPSITEIIEIRSSLTRTLTSPFHTSLVMWTSMSTTTSSSSPHGCTWAVFFATVDPRGGRGVSV